MPTSILAEIADKMGTPTEMWLFCFVVAVIAASISMLHRFVALGMMAVAWFPLAGEFDQAFGDHSFATRIWKELGAVWVIRSIASASLPLLAVVAVLVFDAVKWAEAYREKGQIHLREIGPMAVNEMNSP